MLLLVFAVIAALIPSTFAAGRCITTTPPVSWTVLKAVGIEMWATAGVPSNGSQFCVTVSEKLFLRTCSIGHIRLLRSPRSA
ncbi:hypothetical protein OESDEN_07187 [Oesophagostomum dentatum]|uniref:Secreted protein n=1 Tax=Oesophagostomum dentatum TaxID=61180 RepID=A0A0B1T9S8_OESDE|nr:hypothetical protein OESDEN_07187 [Oesophagostomum dentatum]